MTVGEFKQRLKQYCLRHPSERYGQAAFNLMFDLFPYRAEELRATPYDPFFDDKKADRFIELCLEKEAEDEPGE